MKREKDWSREWKCKEIIKMNWCYLPSELVTLLFVVTEEALILGLIN